MKRQGGQAYILVLILLAVGSLLIIPALRYIATGMYSLRVYENKLTNLYTADSAIEDALWQLLNNLMGNFSTDNTSVAYDFQYGSEHLNVTIKIPTVPPSENYGPIGQVHDLEIDVVPHWVEPPGPYTFNYIIRFATQQWSLTDFKFTLPQGLAYTSSSSYYQPSPSQPGTPAKNAELAYDAAVDLVNHRAQLKGGSWANMVLNNYIETSEWPLPGYQPTNSYLYIYTEADGRQTLDFMPYFNATGNRIFIQTVQVTGTPPWGVNNITDVAFNGGFGSIVIPDPGTAAVGVAMYTILMDIGGVTYQVVVGYDATTGGFKIVSYQALG